MMGTSDPQPGDVLPYQSGAIRDRRSSDVEDPIVDRHRPDSAALRGALCGHGASFYSPGAAVAGPSEWLSAGCVS